MKKTIIFIFVVMLLFLTACGTSSKTSSKADKPIELTVSAASSMMDVLMDVKEKFVAENPGIDVTFNFGGTGALRKQVEQGAPIDVFFSASKQDYEQLMEEGFIDRGKELLQNQLIAIKQKEVPAQSLADFIETEQKLAIGTPEAVPAGFYAQEVLKNMGVWENLQGRLVFAKDVSHVLQLVKDNAVAAGIVYSSDLHRVNGVEVMEEIDPKLHTPISYYVAMIENGNEQSAKKKEAAQQFYNYVQNETSRKLFNQFGFVISNKLVGD
ncbi:molybdate ABC transporter substrate-binding protein [Virgibacillus pantothenticus]|uniref:molybdate ABC transporter substrate-binding protein n=1 Tax=Virgibacillus pantothenticus TaxID=1473 RepID=UPI0009845047|nr:molybdate ABC transporter substrate-binding protein [Virgibacillus pantothenticus]